MLQRIILAVMTSLAAGCLSVPPDVRAEFEAPDGRRPNNFRPLVAGARPGSER